MTLDNDKGSAALARDVSPLDWIRANWVIVSAAIFLVGVYLFYFGIVKIFYNGQLSTWSWAWRAWNPENNYEHAKLIPIIAAFLVWHKRTELRAATIGSSKAGWLFIVIGIILYVVGARTLQGRVTMVALPFLLYGSVLYIWGRNVARILLFPIAFLLFAVPLNFLTQATVKLQFLETGAASAICNFLGVHLNTLGTTMVAADNTFRFEVNEGCSGIRSLMAIAMLSAIYGHLTQDRLWKKLIIFAAAIVFAIVGNAGRLVSIVLVAKWFGQDLAGGPYHTISGYLSFPFALGAMVLFAKLINLKPKNPVGPAAAQGAVSV
jgi:exosortase